MDTPTVSVRYQNRREIEVAITENKPLLERAIVALYERQTEEERVNLTSHFRNGRGFSKADSRVCGLMAKSILKGIRDRNMKYGDILQSSWYKIALKRIPRYSKQLLELHQIKHSRKN